MRTSDIKLRLPLHPFYGNVEDYEMADKDKTGERLLPCPFCGGQTIHLVFDNYASGSPIVDAVCQGCSATVPSCDGENDALHSWNTRTPTPSQGGMQTDGQPVAWRYRRKGNPVWALSPDNLPRWVTLNSEYEYQSLYAVPSQPPASGGVEYFRSNRTNRAFHAALRKYPDAFEALHFFWNEGIAGDAPPPVSDAGRGPRAFEIVFPDGCNLLVTPQSIQGYLDVNPTAVVEPLYARPSAQEQVERATSPLEAFNKIIASLHYDGVDENSLTVGEIRRALP